MRVQTHRISAQAWFALLALALTTWLVLTNIALIFKLSWIVMGALLLSLAIRPVATRLERWRMPRGLTTIALFVLGLGVLVFLGTLLIPVIQAEATELRVRGPALWQTLAGSAQGSPLAQLAPSVQAVVSSATGQWETVVATAIGTVAGFGSLLLNLLVLLSLTYFLTADAAWASSLILGWIPPDQQAHIRNMLDATTQRLTRWVWAQVTLSLFFAIVFSMGLWLLGIPFALTIGMVGGVLTIVPYVGGLIGALLAILSALTLGVAHAAWVALLFGVVTVVQTHLLAPFLYGKTMGLHSALALLALFIGAEIAGIVGVLFAVPVAVIVAVFLQELQKQLLHTRENSLTHETNIE